MSLRGLRSRQESCTYRLNRAALMRMEEGKRKALTKEVGYYDNRTICIQVDNKRNSKQYSSPSDSQVEDEVSKTEDDSPLSEEGVKLGTGVKHHRTRNRDNTSVRSYRPRRIRKDRSKGQLCSDKKLSSEIRRKASYKEPEVENKGLNAEMPSTIQNRKSKGKRRQATTVHRLMTHSSAVQNKLGKLKLSSSPSSSPSSDLQLFERRHSLLRSNKINNRRNLSRISPHHKWYKVITDREQKSKERISIPKSNVMGSTRMEPSNASETESKSDSPLPKRNENRKLLMKQSVDESLLIKQQKMNDELYGYLKGPKKQSAVGISEDPSLEAIKSHECVIEKGKTDRGRPSNKKRIGIMKPTKGSMRLYFKPVTSTVTMTSDQEEVISKWRKRLGTSSPPSPHIRSSNIASSFLRNSQILRVQGPVTHPGRESYMKPIDMSYLIPKKDSPEISLEDVEFQKLVGSMYGKRSNEVFTANEEQEIFLRMEMEKTKKHILYLEELARIKLEKLEAIRWKKKRALEEEAVLNEKLEKLLNKIQQLRESDSFAKLLDKQTQVFATKRIQQNIK